MKKISYELLMVFVNNGYHIPCSIQDTWYETKECGDHPLCQVKEDGKEYIPVPTYHDVIGFLLYQENILISLSVSSFVGIDSDEPYKPLFTTEINDLEFGKWDCVMTEHTTIQDAYDEAFEYIIEKLTIDGELH